LDITNDTKFDRLPAINAGCTTADCAASNAATTALACDEANCADEPAALNHAVYGDAAADIADAAGPCHASLTKPAVTELKNDDADDNSSANPSQAAATATIGADPAPESSLAEFSSGGKVRKLTCSNLFLHEIRKSHEIRHHCTPAEVIAGGVTRTRRTSR
jgi:hypothetical protein